jgi:hypothetical protein
MSPLQPMRHPVYKHLRRLVSKVQSTVYYFSFQKQQQQVFKDVDCKYVYIRLDESKEYLRY